MHVCTTFDWTTYDRIHFQIVQEQNPDEPFGNSGVTYLTVNTRNNTYNT